MKTDRIATPRLRFLVISVTAYLSLVSTNAGAQGTDACAGAQMISGLGPHAFDTSAATTGTQGQTAACGFATGIDDDVWFRWTAPQTGTVLFGTCGQTSVDTKIAAYTGSVCPASGSIACSDDDCNQQSQATFNTTSGVTYMIQIGSSPSNPGGTGTFTFAYVPPATNNDCATPATIAGNGTFPFNNASATTGAQGQMNTGCTNVKKDLWYSWTAPANGIADLSLCGQTGLDSAIAVYSGAGCPSVHSIACDDDFCGLQSSTSWAVVAGSAYMLQIGSASSGSGAVGTFTLELTPTPGNDNCNAPLVIGGPVTIDFDTTAATTGTQGQANSCGPVDLDLWYDWTATASGSVTVDTCGQTGVDTQIAVYAGAACPSSAAFACDNDGCGQQSTVAFNAVLGNHYRIQVGSASSSPGGPGTFTITAGGPTLVAYCFGDGSGTACPCANSGSFGRGCRNSFVASGALLGSSGTASVSADTFLLQGSSMTPTATSLYFQGTLEANNGLGLVTGDGLRCVAGSLIRLGSKTNVGGASSFGAPAGDVAISIKGMIPAPGGTRYYQCWYRNPESFCTSDTYNLSNGLQAVWIP